MKQIRKRLTYANVMSSLAVFLILGGATAFAASQLPKNSVGSKQLKKNAVTTAKIKKNAVNAAKLSAGSVTGEKLAAGAVSGDKLADNSVSSGKLADSAVNAGKLANNAVTTAKITGGAVTTEKLSQSERSEAFQNEISSTSAELPESFGSTAASVVTLSLPAGGSYVVTAQTELILTLGEPVSTDCFLDNGSTEISQMGDTYKAGLIFPTGGVSMTGISSGGTVTLACKSTDEDTFAFHRKIVAVRVGSVTG